jgi:hypothetical protein
MKMKGWRMADGGGADGRMWLWLWFSRQAEGSILTFSRHFRVPQHYVPASAKPNTDPRPSISMIMNINQIQYPIHISYSY